MFKNMRKPRKSVPLKRPAECFPKAGTWKTPAEYIQQFYMLNRLKACSSTTERQQHGRYSGLV